MVRINVFGESYCLKTRGLPRTRISRNIEGIKEYKVEIDTKKRYPLDTIITRTEYERVKRNYDLRIIRWVSGIVPLTTGRKQYFISGRNRMAVKDVESEHADEIYEQRDYILIVGDKVHPFNIASIGEKMGSVLYLDTKSISGLPEKKVREYRQMSLIK